MADQNNRFLSTHKLVIGAPCSDIATAWDNTTYALGDYVHLGKYSHLTIVLIGGAAAGAASAFTVKQATSFAGAGAKNVTFTEMFANVATSSASDTWTSTAVTSNTFTPTTTTAKLSYVIEIDSRDLDIAGGFEFVGANFAGGGGINYFACLYILSEGRFLTRSGMPTAIA